MAKVYLHHKEEESRVFDTESEEYAEAINNGGWCQDRTFGKQEKVDIGVAKALTLKDVSTEALLFELEARGYFWTGTKKAPDNSGAINDAALEAEKEEEGTVVLSELKSAALKEIAKSLGIPNSSKMNKEELIESIVAADEAKEEASE